MAQMMAQNRIKPYLLAFCLVGMLGSWGGARHASAQNILGLNLREQQLPDPGHHILREPLPLGDLQLFAPADITLYGGDPKVNEGYFGGWEYLYWSISAPDRKVIGQPGLVRQVHDGGLTRLQGSTFDTGNFESQFHNGNRFQFGYADGSLGWWVSGFKLQSENQHFGRGDTDVAFVDQFQTVTFFDRDPITRIFFSSSKSVGLLQGFVDQSPVDTVDDDQNLNGVFGRFTDGDGDGMIDPASEADALDPAFYDLNDLVNLPVTFSQMVIRNKTDMWGIELMPFTRLRPTHGGSHFEFAGGVRFLRFNDQFDVDAQGGFLIDRGQNMQVGTSSPIPPVESFWSTQARNDIIGPQLAARWFKTFGRLTMSAEGRYLAGFNFQQIHQDGTLGSNPAGSTQPSIGPRVTQQNALLFFNPVSFNHDDNENEFSNVVELRIKADVQLTRAISFTIGYNGMWMNGIARSTSLVQYRLPVMGINVDDNRQDLMVHGVNLGIVINR